MRPPHLVQVNLTDDQTHAADLLPAEANSDTLPGLGAAGVTEVVVVGEPPPAPDAATTWVAELARTWIRPAE
ncbi:hypothetical protein ACGFWI_37995 [Streptomyces sp. NPDC048434]|uniref:hypothetical protein n=1 Tax=Streptomyces sp. NPDC048434 TaxID=3365549 RepID=UPI0037155D38